MFSSKIRSEFKILDFDIECRPLSWYGGDFVTKEITAIAAKFIGEKGPAQCWLLGVQTPQEILEGFLEMYNVAGMVTGHFIRGFDLPLLNSSLTEYGYQPLQSKLTQDTKLDLIKRNGMSGSQENLGAMLGLEHPKVGMSQEDWREANRLTPEGIKKTKERAIGDVEQHIEMRQRLIDAHMLGRPKVWNSVGNSPQPKYFG